MSTMSEKERRARFGITRTGGWEPWILPIQHRAHRLEACLVDRLVRDGEHLVTKKNAASVYRAAQHACWQFGCEDPVLPVVGEDLEVYASEVGITAYVEMREAEYCRRCLAREAKQTPTKKTKQRRKAA